ncbi:hypothetical protein HDU96_003415 [Phlyctochytrium bullatum]|nr:hypothetical protein HDU96_003415 [Phlyctochytrium bullatum]
MLRLRPFVEEVYRSGKALGSQSTVRLELKQFWLDLSGNLEVMIKYMAEKKALVSSNMVALLLAVYSKVKAFPKFSLTGVFDILSNKSTKPTQAKEGPQDFGPLLDVSEAFAFNDNEADEDTKEDERLEIVPDQYADVPLSEMLLSNAVQRSANEVFADKRYQLEDAGDNFKLWALMDSERLYGEVADRAIETVSRKLEGYNPATNAPYTSSAEVRDLKPCMK